MSSFKQALLESKKRSEPLTILGTINAYSALQATKASAKALYLSGAGVANASLGLPDLGISNLEDICIDIRRITYITKLPLLVDIDTGFGGAFNIERTIKEVARAGASAVHIEDQVAQKRCGHRPNKELVDTKEMQDRLKACINAKASLDKDFSIMARTDAFANEGLHKALERALAYEEVGADMIFAEALSTLEDYKLFCTELKVPVLANITEFGKTPYFTKEELKSVGVDMILYPLSAFRAMNKAALNVYKDILEHGSQKQSLDSMQTRDELYAMLDYLEYEKTLDKLFGK
ncbi:methylisocitrate lyase [Helicobacter sp. 11S02629-2]|uniref:methylisocitrate lyase n=1 Tax=Helicobacter sp. 11S02629-2 TaxID=1476195 RepID=UPI000BA74703|nr:methylisocitrate lyase [Helicobacter sp. 11S02629-2]PAF45985.1 methylisocitrate lyase [Helicobacter sp. 11S02629-2]